MKNVANERTRLQLSGMSLSSSVGRLVGLRSTVPPGIIKESYSRKQVFLLIVAEHARRSFFEALLLQLYTLLSRSGWLGNNIADKKSFPVAGPYIPGDLLFISLPHLGIVCGTTRSSFKHMKSTCKDFFCNLLYFPTAPTYRTPVPALERDKKHKGED